MLLAAFGLWRLAGYRVGGHTDDGEQAGPKGESGWQTSDLAETRSKKRRKKKKASSDSDDGNSACKPAQEKTRAGRTQDDSYGSGSSEVLTFPDGGQRSKNGDKKTQEREGG